MDRWGTKGSGGGKGLVEVPVQRRTSTFSFLVVPTRFLSSCLLSSALHRKAEVSYFHHGWVRTFRPDFAFVSSSDLVTQALGVPPLVFPVGCLWQRDLFLAECRLTSRSVSATTCVHFHANRDPAESVLHPRGLYIRGLCGLWINCAQWLFHVFPACLFWQAWMCKPCQHLARSACPKQLFTQFESILVNWVNNGPLQKIYKSINMSLYIPNRQK